MDQRMAELMYPSDGMTVQCQCGRWHTRHHGWGHINHPTCDECECRHLLLTEIILKEIKEAEHEIN